MTRRLKEPFSGLSHGAAAIGFAIAAAVMAPSLRSDVMTMAGFVVFIVTLICLYAASATYHLTPVTGEREAFLRKLDHSAIFLFIAGSCTPIFLHAFDGVRRTAMVSLVWVIAVIGIGTRLLWQKAPRWFYTANYVAMGWLLVLQAGPFRRGVTTEVFALTVGGGLVYTLGAVVYALKKPNLFPGKFGFHELWHLFVIGGSALHFVAITILSRG